MKRECIEELINANREIEFTYRGRRYSIVYYNDDREKYISFGEFYKTPIDVANPAEIFKIRIGSRTLEEIFDSLPDSAFDIY